MEALASHTGLYYWAYILILYILIFPLTNGGFCVKVKIEPLKLNPEERTMQTYEDILRSFIIPWQNIRRWRGRPRPKKENVLMHTYKECMNTMYALSQEKDSAHPLNSLQILVAKLFHDIGEGLLGCDIPYPIKTDKRLSGIFDEIERDEIESFLNKLPPQTKKFLKCSLDLLVQDTTRAGKLVQAIEYYGYLSFALAEIKTEGKGNSNAIGFYQVVAEHGHQLWEYSKPFQFVKQFKEIVERQETGCFEPDAWLPEFTLRKILDAWTNPELGRAWPDLETNENLLERTMKTAFLAAFLIPQELACGTRLNGYDILCAALVHKLDKVDFPVLAPKMRKNKKLRKYERGFRQMQREHLLPTVADYRQFCPEAHEVILRAYALERDRESLNGRFFDAIKNLSYVLFAHYEFARGKKEFYQVFKNCDDDLMTYSKEFKSVRDIYLPVKEEITKLVKEESAHEKLAKRIDALEKENADLKETIESRKK